MNTTPDVLKMMTERVQKEQNKHAPQTNELLDNVYRRLTSFQPPEQQFDENEVEPEPQESTLFTEFPEVLFLEQENAEDLIDPLLTEFELMTKRVKKEQGKHSPSTNVFLDSVYRRLLEHQEQNEQNIFRADSILSFDQNFGFDPSFPAETATVSGTASANVDDLTSRVMQEQDIHDPLTNQLMKYTLQRLVAARDEIS